MDSVKIKLKKAITAASIGFIGGGIMMIVVTRLLDHSDLNIVLLIFLMTPFWVVWCIGAGFWNLFWIKDSLIGKVIYSLMTICLTLIFMSALYFIND